jgi:hypothetical protein
MAPARLILITIIWSSLALFLDGMTGRNLAKQYESNHFLTAPGRITQSEVHRYVTRKGHVRYTPKIAYSYQIGDKSFYDSRVRFVNSMSHSFEEANDIVIKYPLNADVTVYYNPNDHEEALLSPGIDDADFLMGFLLTPLNAAMLGFWIMIGDLWRERTFRPVAGGMKVTVEKGCTRVRLPQLWPIFYGLVTAGVLGLVFFFALLYSTSAHPTITHVVTSCIIVYGGGLVAYIWQWQTLRTGIDDLIIHEFQKTLELPLTYGRKERITVNISDVEIVWVEKRIHTSSKGNVSYTYAPTLRMPKKQPSFQKLADWSDKLKADDFAAWLGKKINVPTSDS